MALEDHPYRQRDSAFAEFDAPDTSDFVDAPPAALAVVQTAQQLAPVSGGAAGLTAALLQAAQGRTRDIKAKLEAAQRVGQLMGEDAWYAFKVNTKNGEQVISGPSIDLMQALASEWGSISFSVEFTSVEQLATGGRRIHMRAQVVDLIACVYASVEQQVTTSSPPGRFREGEQAERWYMMQTQAAASKIVRNALERVLPAYMQDAALRAARDAHSSSQLFIMVDGKRTKASIEEVRESVATKFSGIGITRGQLEAFINTPTDLWTVTDIARLREVGKDIINGRVPAKSVFPSAPAEQAARTEDDTQPYADPPKDSADATAATSAPASPVLTFDAAKWTADRSLRKADAVVKEFLATAATLPPETATALENAVVAMLAKKPGVGSETAADAMIAEARRKSG